MMKTIVGSLGACGLSFAIASVAMAPARGAQPQQPAAARPAPSASGTSGAPGQQQPPAAAPRRVNPTALLYEQRCAACHGTTTAPGRAPTLFDDEWTRAKDDEGIARVIAEGVPQTEMMPFKEQLTEAQIWQLVVYLRAQAGSLKPPPPFIADPDGQIVTSARQTFRMEVVARDIETPWGLAFLPDGRLLITERPGRLRIVQNGELLPEPVRGTPKVWERQDGGLFDVEVHPRYADKGNGWIYVSYSSPAPNYTPPADASAPGATAAANAASRGPAQSPTIPSMTAIVRGRINARHEWVDQQFIYEPPLDRYTPSNIHYGSRLLFDRQGHLFYTIGDRGVIPSAQDLTKVTGKIHRVRDDGSVPPDNPFVKTAGAVPTIWSYGHRNPQGLAWDPVTGQLWETEHGPQGGDEVNVVERGNNYGWGEITSGAQAGIEKRAAPGMESPKAYYTPAIAPSGIAFVTGTRYPSWKHQLFVSALRGQQLRRLETRGGKVLAQEAVFDRYGRVHDVIEGPDGYLYVTLQVPGKSLPDSTPGLVARLVPVAK
jgi:glucose/arabinose dehydrogenase